MFRPVIAESQDSASDSELRLASVFATLACELNRVSGVDQILVTVLEFAMVAVPCDRITISLLPTKRRTGVSATAPADDGLPESVSHARSIHAVELLAGFTSLGTIGFFAGHSRGFSAADTAAAELLAIHAALAIGAARRAANLTDVIDTRTVVAQAQGIVMAGADVDQVQAFEVLRRYSQDNNIKLRDVAREVVVSRCLPVAGKRV